MLLYHYFDKSTGPFKNLSDLSVENAEKMLVQIKQNRPASQCASRDENYIKRRIGYENLVRRIFVEDGGKATRKTPHYMTVEHCDWLYSWYENPAFVRIPLEEFDAATLSFTYGDMHPTFSPIVNDGREYRKKLYRLDSILPVIEKYGLPQETPPFVGEIGHPYYVEVQVWSDETVARYVDPKYWITLEKR